MHLAALVNAFVARQHPSGVVFDFDNQTVGAFKTYVCRALLFIIFINDNVRRMIV